jgi:hypothetical protein
MKDRPGCFLIAGRCESGRPPRSVVPGRLTPFPPFFFFFFSFSIELFPHPPTLPAIGPSLRPYFPRSIPASTTNHVSQTLTLTPNLLLWAVAALPLPSPVLPRSALVPVPPLTAGSVNAEVSLRHPVHLMHLWLALPPASWL